MSCKHAGKTVYADRKQATRALRYLAGRHGSMHTYRCGFCGFWHVGHRTPRGKVNPYDRNRFKEGTRNLI